MSTRRRLAYSLLLVVLVLVVGAAGYLVIEKDKGISWLDAVFMTVITLASVGYSETWPLSDAGRIWTIGVIVVGIGAVSTAFSSMVGMVVGGELQKTRERWRMDRQIERMQAHIIVCGYGRMSELVVAELQRRHVPFVVIECDPIRIERLKALHIPYIEGDATDEAILESAGAGRARALVAALPSDADNVFITVTAHTLYPSVSIVARAEQPATEAKLKRAGASRVVCPQSIGAQKVADVLTRPNVVDFVDIANVGMQLEMDEYVVGPKSLLLGRNLKDSLLREKTGAMVVAIKRADGRTMFNPGPNEVFQENDTLIVVGPAGVSTLLDKIS